MTKRWAPPFCGLLFGLALIPSLSYGVEIKIQITAAELNQLRNISEEEFDENPFFVLFEHEGHLLVYNLTQFENLVPGDHAAKFEDMRVARRPIKKEFLQSHPQRMAKKIETFFNNNSNIVGILST